MPLQNRVTPFGAIVADPARGRFTGNRGILHDPATRTLRRAWAGKAWLICRLDFEDRRRPVMGKGWTELFFLDEATALAAGHRPCFFCRRAEAEAFRDAVAAGRPLRAAAMDTVLHTERLAGRAKRLHPLAGAAEDLPDGAMVAAGGAAYLVHAGRLRPWSASGYGPAVRRAAVDGVLTPPAALAALAAGYRPDLHPSAFAPSG
ncbi:hypothetical protein [Methylobrevis albus]|uniref:Uncharacterized protein n=1 Tax=Methylobrevis albus TaxID=2793297 RepID=A0A931HZ16_9HYPH|nr:hypothetical protein [Methylobrevis albus]MBH0236329.1 hypothetical protein [Methylobrevis albus]